MSHMVVKNVFYVLYRIRIPIRIQTGMSYSKMNTVEDITADRQGGSSLLTSVALVVKSAESGIKDHLEEIQEEEKKKSKNQRKNKNKNKNFRLCSQAMRIQAKVKLKMTSLLLVLLLPLLLLPPTETMHTHPS